jgi:hypothetical protein
VLPGQLILHHADVPRASRATAIERPHTTV